VKLNANYYFYYIIIINNIIIYGSDLAAVKNLIESTVCSRPVILEDKLVLANELLLTCLFFKKVVVTITVASETRNLKVRVLSLRATDYIL
jgi:hypothetical protein